MAELEAEFSAPPVELAEALAYCDMTTDPDGRPTDIEDRLGEIKARYGADHVVARSVARSTPSLRSMTEAIVRRLRQPASPGEG